MTPEKRIEMQVCSWLKYKGYFFWKNESHGVWDPIRKAFRSNKNPYRIKGVSDILGVMAGGKILAIEVKSKTGRVSPEQTVFLKLVNACGGKGFVARSIEDLEKNLCPIKEQIVGASKFN